MEIARLVVENGAKFECEEQNANVLREVNIEAFGNRFGAKLLDCAWLNLLQ